VGGAIPRSQDHQIDPETGAILRTIESNRFVTGVTWVDGELWHGTWEGDESELRRIDPDSGAVLERLEMPSGTYISGLESDGADLFYCGGGPSGKVRAVRRPLRARDEDLIVDACWRDQDGRGCRAYCAAIVLISDVRRRRRILSHERTPRTAFRALRRVGRTAEQQSIDSGHPALRLRSTRSRCCCLADALLSFA
jgi:hypothetical protein